MRRRRPVWRAFLCLLLGGLAWWLVQRWLEPKPLWVREPSERDTVFWPMCEDREGKYLLAWEEAASGKPSGLQASLVILDQQTGKLLHYTPHTVEELYGGDYHPRIVGQHAWRVRENLKNDTLELRRWDLTGPERIVHSWKGSHFHSIHPQWSVSGQRLVLRYCFDYLQLWQNWDYTGCLDRPLACLMQHQPCFLAWYETWHIPIAVDEPPRLVARWTCHYSRWLELPNLNDDGTLAVFSDAYAQPSEAHLQLRQAASFRGNELVGIIRRRPHGSLIYDTASGQLVQQVNTNDIIHHQSSWLGNYLLVQGTRVPPDTTLTRDQVILTLKREPAPKYFQDVNVCWDVDPDRGQYQPIELPDELRTIDLVFGSINGVGIGIWQINRDQVFVLEREHNQWQVHQANTRQLPYDGLTSVWSVPGTKQLVYRSVAQPTVLEQLHEWALGKDWLARWLPRLSPKRADHTLHDLKSQAEHRLPGYCASIDKPYMKHLYIMSESLDEQQLPRYGSLSCYAMPLAFHSVWWGRGAGLVITIALWLLTRRASQRKNTHD